MQVSPWTTAEIISAFALGKQALGGFLAGATLMGVFLALFMANSGGAWDNARKHLDEHLDQTHVRGCAGSGSTFLVAVIAFPDVIRTPDELHPVCAAWYIPVPIMAGLKLRQHHAQPSVPRTRQTLAAVEKARQRDRMSA